MKRSRNTHTKWNLILQDAPTKYETFGIVGNGWIQHKNGKPYIVIGKDRNRCPIWEHRLTVEKRIGRLLTSKELVHHINENTIDNRDENLVLITKEEHNKIHAKLKRRRKWTLIPEETELTKSPQLVSLNISG